MIRVAPLAAALVACAHAGPLSTATIDRVVRRHEHDIRACYDIGLSRDPTLTGGLRLEFAIEPSGTTSEVNVSDSTLDHAEVERCLAVIVRRWTFPSSDVRTEVAYPLAFAPEEDLDAPPSPR